VKREKEESLRIGGRELTIWFDKEENVWKAVVLELREEHWIEILSVQSAHEKDVRSLFKDSIEAARAVVLRELDGKEAVEHP
jgi:uncharacterized protein YacL (UPF0231 family)